MKINSAGQFQTQSNAILTASYVVSLQVAKAKKPHNIAETLIKPCLVECAGILFGESAKSKMNKVSLSNNIVKSRIADMACDIKLQLIENIKASPVFGIQLDESVDCANCCCQDKSSKQITRSGSGSTLCYLQNYTSYFINRRQKTRAKITLMVYINIAYIKLFFL